MSPPTVFFGFVALVGFVVTVGAGYLIVRAPFMGGVPLASAHLLGALLAFIAGIVVLAWGGSKALGA